VEISLECANAYFANHLDFDYWNSITDNKKIAAINMAKNYILRLPYIGQVLNAEQEMPFPRVYCARLITMPDDVIKAIFEEALILIKLKDWEQDVVLPDEIQSMSLGSASISFKDSSRKYEISQKSQMFLEPWIKKGFDFSSSAFSEVY
jgi:hypothetical protein